MLARSYFIRDNAMESETYQAYLPQIKKRQDKQPEIWKRNRQQAWQVVRNIAAMLREQYSVSRILLFGSLVDSGRFDQYSDIDLAVEGLDPTLFYQAVARLPDFGKNFHVDLIDLSHCPASFREAILEKGVSL